MHADLCRAIKQRRIVRFHYDGGVREVEPYCHGTSGEGHELLRGYQIDGFSTSGSREGWKTFRLDTAAGLELTDRHFFRIRDPYDRDAPGMATVHCRV
jgi:hypothetical protein